VGLVTVGAPASVQATVAAQQAEVMTEPLPEKRGALARTAATAALRHLASRDALALGPGLGTSPETRGAVQAIVARRPGPAVLDADGLNAYGAGTGKRGVRLHAGAHPLVLTPHPGEAARLLRGTVASVQKDRLGAALRLARDTQAVVVLKGAHSVVASPQGAAAVNSTGNPGMATAGTGDVLTGVVGAFLARGMGGYDAARLAVHVHGDAGDRAARERGIDGMIAQDLLDQLPRALQELRGGAARW
jgi:NAD(P)H-hydrate epimerase